MKFENACKLATYHVVNDSLILLSVNKTTISTEMNKYSQISNMMSSLEFVAFSRTTFWSVDFETIKVVLLAFQIRCEMFFSRLKHQLPRTNNSSEGWHRAIQVVWSLIYFHDKVAHKFCLALSTRKPINLRIYQRLENRTAREFDNGWTVASWGC